MASWQPPPPQQQQPAAVGVALPAQGGARGAGAGSNLSAVIERVATAFFHPPRAHAAARALAGARCCSGARARAAAAQRGRPAAAAAACGLLLAALTAQPTLRVIATVDHVNAPLLIDEEATLRGQFVRQRVPKNPKPRTI